MATSPERSLTYPECLLTFFALDKPDGRESLNRHLAAWPEHTSVEELDESHVILVVSPGWASRSAT